jgi:hypothetical protein
MNKTLYKPSLGKKSLLIVLGITFLLSLTGCTEKSKDNVTAVDNKSYQSNTDAQSGTSDETNNGTNDGTNDNVPSCH